MNALHSFRNIPKNPVFRKGDVFMLFGELVGRGYANGLVNEARKAGMTIVGTTLGRREGNNSLRSLNREELATSEAHLGGRIINIPLMAGFDLDAPDGEPAPADLLSSMTIKGWQHERLDWRHIEKCREAGVRRFRNSLSEVMSDLDGEIRNGSNVIFAHAMAGGIPRVKVFLAIANRVYKGTGDRFMSSRSLIESDLGKLVLMNFEEVTAHTFQYLIDASAPIRVRLEESGGHSYYTAFGYHGSEILIDGKYQWQTYPNYTQGYAKLRLEQIATAAWNQGAKATVFNCPEIRTNSSDIFAGLELSLYPLIESLKREGGGFWAEDERKACRALLKDAVSLESLLQKVDDYHQSKLLAPHRNYEEWPLGNSAALAELMIGTSEEITQMHRDGKSLISDRLSALVLEGTGSLIFREVSAGPSAPVLWLNHDRIARQLNIIHS